MKKIFYLALIVLSVSCGSTKTIGIQENHIEKVEITQADKTIELKEEFAVQLIDDLNNSKYLGPTKFMKTHWILIYHSNGSVDSVLTNGTVHQYDGWFKSEENLIEKYRN